MPDVNAAIGLAQLERAWSMRDRRQRCAARYFERLAGLDALDLPLVHVPHEDHAWHLFVVGRRARGASVGRDRLIELLAERGSAPRSPTSRCTA